MTVAFPTIFPLPSLRSPVPEVASDATLVAERLLVRHSAAANLLDCSSATFFFLLTDFFGASSLHDWLSSSSVITELRELPLGSEEEIIEEDVSWE